MAGNSLRNRKRGRLCFLPYPTEPALNYDAGAVFRKKPAGESWMAIVGLVYEDIVNV